jgi:hypothetical protein
MKKRLMLFCLALLILSFSLVSAQEVSCDNSTLFFFQSRDNISYDGKFITAIAINSSSAVINVDRTSEIIFKGVTKEVNDLSITVEDIFLRSDPTETSVVLTIMCVEKVSCDEAFLMYPGDKVKYEDKVLVLVNVSRERVVSKVVVSVDGTSKEIEGVDNTKKVKRLYIKLLAVGYEEKRPGIENSAMLAIKCSQCNDRLDNDKDGLIDYPEDDGCSSSHDNKERTFLSFDEVLEAPRLGAPSAVGLSLLWVWLIVGLVVVASGAVYWYTRKKPAKQRKKRK